MSTIVLTQQGEHTFLVPAGVTTIDVKCYGKQGYQSVESMSVESGVEFTYYIESENDSICTYFGPYLCALDDSNVQHVPKIEITLWQE